MAVCHETSEHLRPAGGLGGGEPMDSCDFPMVELMVEPMVEPVVHDS